MRIIILAAGYGTRLYPLTLSKAKCLIDINEKPIINYLFEKIDRLRQSCSVEEIIIVSNNKFYEDFIDWKEKYAIDATILNDGTNCPEERLGAVRAIQFAFDQKQGDFLVLGSDNMFDDSLLDFFAFSEKRKPFASIGLHDVKSKELASRYGVLALDEENRIIDFQEKPENPKSTLAATCIYFFPQEVLGTLDAFIEQEKHIDAAGKFIESLVNTTDVFGYVLEGRWVDIGKLDALQCAESFFGEVC